MSRVIGGYPVAQLELMLRQEQRQLNAEIASLRREINTQERLLAAKVARLKELDNAETLLRG